MFQNYFDGKGNPVTLTLDEVRQVITDREQVGLSLSEKFNDEYLKAIDRNICSFKGEFTSSAATDLAGTLGNFTIIYNVDVKIIESNGAKYWTAKGTATVYDVYDFNPEPKNWLGKGARSLAGEFKTLMMYLFSAGLPFKITSEPFSYEDANYKKAILGF